MSPMSRGDPFFRQEWSCSEPLSQAYYLRKPWKLTVTVDYKISQSCFPACALLDSIQEGSYIYHWKSSCVLLASSEKTLFHCWGFCLAIQKFLCDIKQKVLTILIYLISKEYDGPALRKNEYFELSWSIINIFPIKMKY